MINYKRRLKNEENMWLAHLKEPKNLSLMEVWSPFTIKYVLNHTPCRDIGCSLGGQPTVSWMFLHVNCQRLEGIQSKMNTETHVVTFLWIFLEWVWNLGKIWRDTRNWDSKYERNIKSEKN